MNYARAQKYNGLQVVEHSDYFETKPDNDPWYKAAVEEVKRTIFNFSQCYEANILN